LQEWAKHSLPVHIDQLFATEEPLRKVIKFFRRRPSFWNRWPRSHYTTAAEDDVVDKDVSPFKQGLQLNECLFKPGQAFMPKTTNEPPRSP
jgi:hypothetical protein